MSASTEEKIAQALAKSPGSLRFDGAEILEDFSVFYAKIFKIFFESRALRARAAYGRRPTGAAPYGRMLTLRSTFRHPGGQC